MTILDRSTLLDRPELTEVVQSALNDEEEQESQDSDTEVETIGEGGGPVINGLEFRPDDYNVIAASNLAATLATGEKGGGGYRETFRNAAIQLSSVEEDNSNLDETAKFAEQMDVADVNVSSAELAMLTVVDGADVKVGEVDSDEVSDRGEDEATPDDDEPEETAE